MTVPLPPPNRIYLLRHAEAAWAEPGQRDFDRPLNEKGFGDAEIIADKAADKGYRPNLLISSTALRCRGTADAVHRAMGLTLDLRYVDALYNATVDNYLEIVDSQEEAAVMLVGHNPTMEQTLEVLIGHEAMVSALPGGFPTAGLAVVDYDAAAGGWRLTDFVVV
ncbi:phosphohistidine phosphatase SixA [Rhizobium leguminosarum bv. trifolii WSM597]|uniref:Phosphohistidine phosphatase SixA n=3 Tax=Rhizobium TaxID=379 RepID=I9X161_RHILT|nr:MULTISPECIES: histidine phosphatase family protein [Rhizobium]EJB02446.1 phosphohistidine phosphatase SixA [Rhizobium leguminosarum bv. trifolii WSM597]KPH08194.1 phosphohistidine phosphatase [Rhizobium acidisoli]MBB6222983.1 phosphohistidine phosphatase [Rhizobium leguminosarum]QAS78362.1 histidine phosphatase family protein [Rhizobium acidisoli]